MQELSYTGIKGAFSIEIFLSQRFPVYIVNANVLLRIVKFANV